MLELAYPQPEWNTVDSVREALEAASNASDKESSQSAYNKLLYAVGNNHGGSYYPVVLATFTEVEAILRSGKPWPQRAVIEALIDLVTSFTPEPGHEVFQGRSLAHSLRERVVGFRAYFSEIAIGDGAAAASAAEILKCLGKEAESA